jgi:hypothetical protein
MHTENSTMRCIFGLCVVLAVATPAWAQNNVPTQGAFFGQPTAPVATSGQPTAPVATVPANVGNTVTAQPGATTMVPAGTAPNTYYYPAANSGGMYQTTAPLNVYSTNSGPIYRGGAPYYYTTVRRGPFGLFRRRVAQPAYATAAYTTTPTTYTTPGYYYYNRPTTYAVPATTPAANPAYSPTSYTVPNAVTPAGTSTPSTTTPNAVTPAGTSTPSTTTVPAPAIPAAPAPAIPARTPVNPQTEGDAP